ncbi:MAG TPA: murein biosynthesis integral membrane protein MurJ [Candidatus Woesebacteria bacterium]|nr:murein biosynthesis integral membrane protein MurJ [Candidatus Woesebacteria bacterium]HNS94609.1 murein biosynthesis integral membrane protein MurJ [Candidatus Woesebacteria bacterium]
MNNLLRKTRDFVFSQQAGIISSTILIAGMLLIARVFGFIRYRVLNGYFTKEELDLFYAAFRIPDFVFEVLITGALTTTFIPFYLKFNNHKGKQSAITSSIINIVTLLLMGAIGILYVLMPWLTKLVTPGFSEVQLAEVVRLSRMLLVGQLPFLVFGNFLTGISQAHKSFFIPSLAPVLYNVAIVCVTVLFAPHYHLYAAVYGVVAGSLIFFVIQLLILWRIPFDYRPIIHHIEEIRHFFRVVIPRVFTVFAAQIEATIDLSLTTLLSQGSYTIFYLAQHLQLLPVSIIGMAFGQASLPYLSEMFQQQKIAEMKKIVVDSLSNLFFITMPIAGFIIANRTAVVRLVYGGTKFDWEATVLTAITLSFFCLSLPFHSVYYFLTRCFYAAMDSRTPFIVSLIAITLNTIMSLLAVVVFKLPVWSLAITFSITISMQVAVLFILFWRIIGGFDVIAMMKDFAKVIIATALASIITFDIRRLLDGLIFDTTRTINLFLLMVLAFVIMVSTYLFASWTLDARGLYLVSRALLRVKQMQKRVLELFTGIQT